MGQAACHEGEALVAFKALLTEIEKMKRFGFSSDEIARAKSELLSAYESAAKSADSRKNEELVQPLINNFFDNYAYMHPQTEYEIVEQLLPMLQDQMINQVVAQFIPENNLVVLYKGPEKEGLVTPTAEDVSMAGEDVDKTGREG